MKSNLTTEKLEQGADFWRGATQSMLACVPEYLAATGSVMTERNVRVALNSGRFTAWVFERHQNGQEVKP